MVGDLQSDGHPYSKIQSVYCKEIECGSEDFPPKSNAMTVDTACLVHAESFDPI